MEPTVNVQLASASIDAYAMRKTLSFLPFHDPIPKSLNSLPIVLDKICVLYVSQRFAHLLEARQVARIESAVACYVDRSLILIME